MNRFKTYALAAAALLVAGTSAQAGCNLSHVSGKRWIVSATDVGVTNKHLIYCGFVTSAAGTIALTPLGCTVNHPTDPDFSTSAKFDLVSGSLALVPGGNCVFDVTLVLVAPAGPTIKSRVVLEPKKNSGSGNWVSNFNSYGTLAMMRQ